MRSPLRSAVALLVGVVAACAPVGEQPGSAVEETDTTEADVEAINSVREALVAADNDSDLDALIAVFTDDVVFMLADEPTLTGKEALRSWYFVGPGYEMSSDEVVVAGDWAFDRGSWSAHDDRGRYIVILQRQPDGSWKYSRVVGIGSPPPEM